MFQHGADAPLSPAQVRRRTFAVVVALYFALTVTAALKSLGAFPGIGDALTPAALVFMVAFTVGGVLWRLYERTFAEATQTTVNAAVILDTSVLIDGRIVDVLRTSAIDGPLLVAPFVLDELQSLADGGDKARRARGRRGLDVLNQLRADLGDRLQILDAEPSDDMATSVDERLIHLAVRRPARLLTVDFALQKRAQAQGVVVVNWNELATALKPPCLPGDKISLRIVRVGEQPGQGVGYLEDGTMVVVEGAREHLEKQVSLTVTSVTQTAAGRMVFGRCDGLSAS